MWRLLAALRAAGIAGLVHGNSGCRPMDTLLRDIVFGVAHRDLWRFAVLGGWSAVSLTLMVRFFCWE